MRCLLAVDSGGTKCEAIAVGADGSVLGQGRGGYSGQGSGRAARGGSGRTIESVHGAIRQALRGVPFGELHIAGYHRHASLDEILGTRLPGQVVFHPVHEHDGALALAGLDYGIVASAGTGAFVHVVTKEGQHGHLDSLGPILADYGSAYHIGLMAFQAAAKHDWHPRHKTSLKDIVYRTLGVSETSSHGTSLIGVFEAQTDRAVMASLSRAVDTEARKGDAVALSILDKAAFELAETVFDAYDGMHLQGGGYSLVGTGSVIQKSPIYRERLAGHVRKFAADLTLIWTDLPHVVGTALSLLHKIANGDLEAAKARLVQDARELAAMEEE